MAEQPGLLVEIQGVVLVRERGRHQYDHRTALARLPARHPQIREELGHHERESRMHQPAQLPARLAVIQGGQIRITGAASVGDLGSPSGEETMIVLGYAPSIQAHLAIADQYLEECERNCEQISGKLRMLQSAGAGQLQSQCDEVGALVCALSMLQSKTSRIEQKKQSLLEHLDRIRKVELTVEKTVSTDGNCPGVDWLQGTNATPVTYCVVVSNSGEVVVSNVTLTDLDIDPNLSTNLGHFAVGHVVTVSVARTIED